ncbi:hypothetical protein [Streptomyces sp. NPDC056468]
MSSDDVPRSPALVVAAVVIDALQAAVLHTQPAGSYQQDRS